jgi:hypothetical protein
MTAQPLSGGTDQPKREKPVYKKWWFWAVVAAGGYVAYEFATSRSTASQPVGARELPQTGRASTPPGGLMLLRW